MSDTSRPRLKVSREGIVLIKGFSGFRPRAVQDEDGRWVIGYGHTASAREGAAIGEHEADLLLQYDLIPIVKALNEQVAAPLNQHQFDAMASFAVSVGVERFVASDVMQRLNEGRAGEAADALIGWPESATPDAMLRRRAAERALFVSDPSTPVQLAELLAAPLPPPPVETLEAAVPSAFAGSTPDARAAAVASLLGETVSEATPPAAALQTEVGPPVDISPASPAPPPAPATATSYLQRYSPYATAIIGPLPGFDAAPLAAVPVAEPQPSVAEPEPVASAPVEAPAPAAFAPPVLTEAPEPIAVTPLVPGAPAPSPFPPADEALVLTPAVEADFAEARPLWTAEERDARGASGDGEVLFEDEPQIAVLRHEAEPDRARRFDWVETGPFLFMGTVGLVACAASAASFRMATADPADVGDYQLMGWILAAIGAICVVVSSWNLIARWVRPR